MSCRYARHVTHSLIMEKLRGAGGGWDGPAVSSRTDAPRGAPQGGARRRGGTRRDGGVRPGRAPATGTAPSAPPATGPAAGASVGAGLERSRRRGPRGPSRPPRTSPSAAAASSPTSAWWSPSPPPASSAGSASSARTTGAKLNAVANGTINCPCHGSRYAITDGSVVQGPARTGLRTYTVAVDGDEVVLL